MIKNIQRNRDRKKSSPYFNFIKFERLLDKLRQQGIDVTSVDYPVKNLKKYNHFKYYFDNFSEQQIKTQLTFYAKQFEELLD
jgi:hypothetical protein